MIKFLKRSKPECQQLANPALRVLLPTRLLAKIDKTTLKIELTATAARPPKLQKATILTRKVAICRSSDPETLRFSRISHPGATDLASLNGRIDCPLTSWLVVF